MVKASNLMFASLLICLAVLSSAIKLPNHQKPHMTIQTSSKTPFFNDQRGGGTNDEQIASFKQYIDFASTFFHDDILARLEYISNKMNDTYGSDNYGFSVMLMESSNFQWGWSTRSYGQIWATFGPGVDRVFPQASYRFVKDQINSGRTYFHTAGQRGAGIDSTFENIINNIIKSFQISMDRCSCHDTRDISIYLKQYAGSGIWNVYCSQKEVLHLLAFPNDNRYIVTRPKHCYYAIYDMQ